MIDTEFESTEYYHNGQRKYHSLSHAGLYTLEETWDDKGNKGKQSADPLWEEIDEPDSATVDDLEETTCEWEEEEVSTT
jgi:hypothetical protein